MSRKITCYVYRNDTIEYVTEYLVTIGTKEGYTKPTVGEMDELQHKIASKLHKTKAALERLANSSAYDLYVEVEHMWSLGREEMSADLQLQADQYDIDTVKHRLRKNSSGQN